MKVYAVWNIEKKCYYTTGHGCGEGVNIVNFIDKRDLDHFLSRLAAYGNDKKYKVKRISVGG